MMLAIQKTVNIKTRCSFPVCSVVSKSNWNCKPLVESCGTRLTPSITSARRVPTYKTTAGQLTSQRGEMTHGGGSELLALARRFNCFYLQGLQDGACTPFVVEGHQVGLVRPDILRHLQRFPEVFHMRGKVVELNPAFRDYKERTLRIAEVLQTLRKEDQLCTLRGWRDECFAVSVPFSPDLLEMDRSAMSLFGIRNYGVSVTGYIHHPTRGLCIWLQQRSDTKQTWPGKWDCFVSGGLAVGFGVTETTIKEAAEEASVEGDLAKKMVPAGCVSFYFECERGLFPNTEYVYDLELPLEFVPRNTDGEVQNFELLAAADCIQRALTPQFKTTSAPVLIDFLIRKGHITPENEPNYRILVELLHVPLQSLYQFRASEMNGRDDSTCPPTLAQRTSCD